MRYKNFVPTSPAGVVEKLGQPTVPLGVGGGRSRGSFGYLGYVEVVTRVITSISGFMGFVSPK